MGDDILIKAITKSIILRFENKKFQLTDEIKKI